MRLVLVTLAFSLSAVAAWAQTPPSQTSPASGEILTTGQPDAPPSLPSQTAQPIAAQPAADPAAPSATAPAPTPPPVVILAPPPMPAMPSGPAINAGPRLVATGDILETLRASGQFTILLRGLHDTNLEGVLRTNQNLTLFAPPDAAFRALPPSQLASFLAPQNAEMLQKVLIYHLVNARVDGADMRGAAGRILTVEGQDLRVEGRGPLVQVETARVLQTDVGATNGLIHVIDRVMIPPDLGGVLAAAPSGATASDAVAIEPQLLTQPAPR